MKIDAHLAPGTRMVGDLHLDAASAGACAPFVAWLDRLRDTPRVVLLGDVFDAWVGPAHARLPGAQAVVAALVRARARGLELDLIPGNRDFLLDQDFERRSGTRLWPRGFLVELAAARPGRDAQRLLVIHGDELCTLDVGYQRLKRVLRSPPLRWLAPRLPGGVALGVARRLRGSSERAVAHKPAAAKEQQPAEVARLAAAVRADVVVCGHAHRWRDEQLADGTRWIVLDAWGGARDVLAVGPRGELRPERSGAPAQGPGAAGGAPGPPVP